MISRICFAAIKFCSPRYNDGRTMFEIIRKADMIYQFQSAVNEKYLLYLSSALIEQHYRVLSWICRTLLRKEDRNIGSGIKWRSEAEHRES